MNRTIRTIALIAFVVPVAACTDVGTPVEAAIAEAEQQVLGHYNDPGGRHAVVVHPGVGDATETERAIREAVEAAADDGAHLFVLVADSENAATARSVKLIDDGDLSRTARNDAGRADERDEHIEATMSAVMVEVHPDQSLEGADLFGAAKLAIDWVSQGESGTPRVVTIVTGGGVHRSPSLDLLTIHESGQTIDFATVNMPELADNTNVAVVGAGRFVGVDPAPAESFTALVADAWVSWCQALPTGATCRVNGVQAP